MSVGESAAGPFVDSNTFARLYEELRGWTVGPAPTPGLGPNRLGLAVLLRGGMGQWMATCPSLCDAVKSPSAAPSMTGPLTGSTQAQLTVVLGTILLTRSAGGVP